VLAFELSTLEEGFVGRMRHNQQSRTICMALFRWHVEELVIINIFMNPKNEVTISVSQKTSIRSFPCGTTICLARPPDVIEVADMDL
jgi:hypothetical protein